VCAACTSCTPWRRLGSALLCCPVLCRGLLCSVTPPVLFVRTCAMHNMLCCYYLRFAHTPPSPSHHHHHDDHHHHQQH
jgi:hypothetical protein